MTRGRLAVVLAVSVALVSFATLSAEVKSQEKSQVKFEGILGRMMGLFGGKAVREGVVSTVAVKGDRMMRVTDTNGELIDLGEEKVYQIDFKNKSYKVRTFAEIRQEMEEQMRKAKEAMAKSEGKKETSKDTSKEQPQMEAEVSTKDTGQRKTVNGFDCREVVITILVHEKGKKIEESGGLVLTADSWLAPKNPALQEIGEFSLKYWKAIQAPAMADAAQGMAQAMAMYPGLSEALQKMQTEKVNMDGTPILTTTKIETQRNPQQAAESDQQEQPKPSGGIGDVLGGLGKLRRDKKADENATPAAGAEDKNRATFMTTVNEVLSVAPAVSDADVSVPAGFKQK